MKKALLKILLLLIFISATYAGFNGQAGETGEGSPEQIPEQTQKKKTYEPAGKFVPSEKLSADDSIAFPVDI